MYRIAVVAGAMGIGFVTVVAIQRWGVADGTVGYYTATLLLGQTLGSLLAGMLADHFGHKTPLMIGAAAQIAGFSTALLGAGPTSYYVVFALLGFSMGIHLVSGTLVSLEFSVPAQRPTYIGISNTTAGLTSLVAPMLGGFLAAVSYQLLFSTCIVVGFGALVWLVIGVRDPRSIDARPAVAA